MRPMTTNLQIGAKEACFERRGVAGDQVSRSRSGTGGLGSDWTWVKLSGANRASQPTGSSRGLHIAIAADANALPSQFL